MAERPGLIPTILVTGFLGAGKTTLLNRLIDHYHKTKTVLLINEFGKAGIDGSLLKQGNYEKIELNRGSLFCICIRTDFISEVENIATQLKPGLLIIEATGLADTTEMERMLALPVLKQYILLKASICLVDCQTFLKIKDNLKAPVSQVKSADIVLINKTDLVSNEVINEINNHIKQISPTVPVIETTYSTFPLELLDNTKRLPSPDNAIPGEGRPDPLFSLTLEGEGSFTRENWNQFEKFIKSKFQRFKGFVFIDKQLHHLDATSEQWNMNPIQKPQIKQNTLVFIGQHFDKQQIEAAFQQYLTDS